MVHIDDQPILIWPSKELAFNARDAFTLYDLCVEELHNFVANDIVAHNTTFPELAASIGRVVPVAAKMNVAQEELFAGFATLTGVTGSAAEVSTQLAGI